ncbi:MAG: ABC transporter ATP-binding protein/permease [Eubacteriales bacterium]|nr:ABC transporter ATP-binding protein/permease [Eubacteriales bacterium]
MLQLKNIYKQYRTGNLVQNALQDVNLSLRDSEFVSVLGPSGSGKTTLLNVIGGLDRYDSGDLIINGVSTKNYSDRDWDTYRNRTIGFVFQSYNLIPHQTVLSNVELAMTISGVSREMRRKRAEKALRRVGLGNQMHKRPGQMSGGQMQRVAIARALVNNPDILLADEPTGALDTETSIQIMDILKEVAKDRLVVMVTHNPELARQYSSRIINLRDGEITGDSMPYDPEAGDDAASGASSDSGLTGAAENVIDSRRTGNYTAGISGGVSAGGAGGNERNSHRRKRSNMSFLTSLSLSFNNLRTKKGRTILTSFAGSIGIIGIALVLALTTGVRTYISDLQKDTLTAYPLTVESHAVDLSGIGTDSGNQNKSSTEHKDGVYADNSGSLTSGMVTNNLQKFKKYLDNPESSIRNYIGQNGIIYSYDVNFDAFSYDPSGAFVNSGADPNSTNPLSSSSGSDSGGVSLFSNSTTNGTAANFSELMAGSDGSSVSQVLKDNYDVLYGEWPEEKDQVILVLDENNALSTEVLYQFGLITKEKYSEMNREISDNGEAQKISLDYAALCGRTFYIVPACDRYSENENGTFTRLDDSSADINDLVSKGLQVKISGIVRPRKGESTASISTAVGYTRALTDYLISRTNDSAVVKAQMSSPNKNVLNGIDFKASTDEEKISEAKKYISSLGVSDKASMYQRIMMYMAKNGATAAADQTADAGASAADASGGDPSALAAMAAAAGNSTDAPENTAAATDESSIAAAMDAWLAYSPDKNALLTIYSEFLEGYTYNDNMKSFGYVDYADPSSISIYTDSFSDKEAVSDCIDKYNEKVGKADKITYTDYVKLMTSSLNQMTDMISYVLIALMAVSLVVSCIMIGIITHISVMERTREIGILRALGASKRNVSEVFNAETFIIGCLSGIIGVGAAALLTIPMNSILRGVLGNADVHAYLPVQYAAVLILLSILITVFGGLMPAKSAAKKDPVAALRTD